MRLAAAALPLLLLMATCGRAEWAEVRPKGAGFSIQMPATPAEKTQAVQTADGPVALRMYVLEYGDFSYMVSISEISEEVLARRTREQMLDGARDGVAESIQGEVLDESAFSLGDYPGRDVALRDSTAELALRIRILLVGGRLYQFGVVTPRGDRSSASITRFLDSFALLQN
jgi:hypothetical protein